MEVPNYGPIYGPVTNGTGLIGAALASLKLNNSNSLQGYISQVDDSSKTIEALKEENEALKTKVELLEIQFKFILNKLVEVENLLENKKSS